MGPNPASRGQKRFDTAAAEPADDMASQLASALARGNRGIIFNQTLESLDGITAGLCPVPEDRILSIIGCGDQALALLAFGPQITAVDIIAAQIDLLKKRRESAAENDILAFCGNMNLVGFEGYTRRMNYFGEGQRFDNIRTNIDRLEIRGPCSLNDTIAIATRQFSKIYASDALSEVLGFSRDLPTDLVTISNGLLPDGLLYATNGSELDRKQGLLANAKLFKDEELTRRARASEPYYSPCVYRRFQ